MTVVLTLSENSELCDDICSEVAHSTSLVMMQNFQDYEITNDKIDPTKYAKQNFIEFNELSELSAHFSFDFIFGDLLCFFINNCHQTQIGLFKFIIYY
jgi:hypothetical protein